MIKGMCFDLKKSTNALFNSIKRAQAMVRPRKNFTLVIMFSVRKLFFELIASAIESALFSDLFENSYYVVIIKKLMESKYSNTGSALNDTYNFNA